MLSRLMTRREQAILLGIAGAIVLGAGVFWWKGGSGVTPAEPEVVLSPPPPTADAEESVVSVTGAVHEPGVYEFSADDRLVDALERAGGALPEADTQGLNLAARLIDGTTLHVPKEGERDGVSLNPGAYRVQLASSASPDPGATDSPRLRPVNINTANREEIESLPGIGPTYADAILRYREQIPFRKKSDLLYVQGIGPKRFEGIRDLIAVE